MIRCFAGAVLACAWGVAQALGVGDIQVRSGLNQEFEARIDLVSLNSGEFAGVSARLADEEVFRSAGLERPHVLTRLRFEPVRVSDGEAYIRVSSTERIKEPAFSFIVEVRWARGTILREYTVLLNRP